LLAQWLARGVSLDQVRSFYDKYLVASDRRKKFCSQFFGAETKFPSKAATAKLDGSAADEAAVPRFVGVQSVIAHPTLFKRQMPLLPLE
jgi:hypothetical protein